MNRDVIGVLRSEQTYYYYYYYYYYKIFQLRGL
jgi:hypothetical protein